MPATETEKLHTPEHALPPSQVERVVKLSYGQAMVNAVFAASTSGMFLTGYALKLGATNVQMGLLSSVPAMAVGMQLLSAVLVERGVSRKLLTVVGSMLGVFCWIFVIALPGIFAGASTDARVTGLIAAVTLIGAFGNLAGNARGSWLGDLIPPRGLGSFFGRLVLYGGVIGLVLTVLQGRFLDNVKGLGLEAFGWVFGFGVLFGITFSALYLPQPDVPSKRHDISIVGLVRGTFKNRPLLFFMSFAILWNMQTIAWPFYTTYLLRDVKISYTAMGFLSNMQGLLVLISSPLWGRIVERYGCRPVLIICAAITAPVAVAWVWISTPLVVYIAVPMINIVTGFANGGIAVAMSTLVYKVTPQAGRSVQMAIYAIVLAFVASPMAAIGGHLPGWLNAHGVHADIRSTFYASQIFAFAAMLVARKILDPGSAGATELASNLPIHVAKPKTVKNKARL